jgi:hypothetical protein
LTRSVRQPDDFSSISRGTRRGFPRRSEEDTMKNIDTHLLAHITGGTLGTLTASAPARRTGSSSQLQLQTALTGVTSALDSLKQNQNNSGSLEQLLPVAIMAKWIQNR